MGPAATVKAAYRGSTVLSDDPMVAFIDNVISADEIAHIIRCAADRIEQAKVSLEHRAGVIAGRSGGNCWLRYDSDPTVRTIGERIAEIVGIPLSHAEALQVIHYGAGQEYRPHFDAYDLSTPKGQRCCRRGGQRLVTGLVYLNEVEAGGATAFPKLGFAVAARPGRLVLFHNTGADGTAPHPGSLHAGTTVMQGEKWAFNIWFHARPMTEIQHFDSPRRNGAVLAVTSNRAEKLWQRAYSNSGMNFETTGVHFSYWDTYDGSTPNLPRRDRGNRIVQLIDRRIANQLADKSSLAQRLGRSGLDRLAPATYLRADEALRDNPRGTIWFVKPAMGTAGKGIYCVPGERLSTLQIPGGNVLQKGIDDPLLDNGYKFTGRLYALTWNHELRLFETGVTMTHRAPYVRGSTDMAVQVGHRVQYGDCEPIVIRPGSANGAFVDSLSRQRDLVGALRPILSDCLEASDRDHYQILGIDTVIRRDGAVRLLEINTYPNFVHSPEVNDAVNVPFFESVLRTIAGHTDSRLITLR